MCRVALAFAFIAALHSSGTVKAFSTTTLFCNPEADGETWPGCPTSWPSELCTPESGDTLCKCPSGGLAEEACVIGTPSANQPTTGRCAEIIVKVVTTGSDVVLESRLGDAAVQGLVLPAPENAGSPSEVAQEEFFCQRMQKNDKWTDYVRQTSDGSADLGSSWSVYLACWSWFGTIWRDGTCWDSTRYIGESCWDGSWWCGNPGQCMSAEKYSEYAVACYESECTMWAQATYLERQQCECGVAGGGFAYLWFACTSPTCDGHACVLSASNGKYYCDYATPQTVTGWFR